MSNQVKARTHAYNQSNTYGEFHRTLDKSLYTMDIDEIYTSSSWIESDISNPLILVETKHENSKNKYDLNCYQYRVLGKLGEKADMPAFSVIYNEKCTLFEIIPLNSQARAYITQPFEKHQKHPPERYEEFLLMVKEKEKIRQS